MLKGALSRWKDPLSAVGIVPGYRENVSSRVGWSDVAACKEEKKREGEHG